MAWGLGRLGPGTPILGHSTVQSTAADSSQGQTFRVLQEAQKGSLMLTPSASPVATGTDHTVPICHAAKRLSLCAGQSLQPFARIWIQETAVHSRAGQGGRERGKPAHPGAPESSRAPASGPARGPRVLPWKPAGGRLWGPSGQLRHQHLCAESPARLKLAGLPCPSPQESPRLRPHCRSWFPGDRAKPEAMACSQG